MIQKTVKLLSQGFSSKFTHWSLKNQNFEGKYLQNGGKHDGILLFPTSLSKILQKENVLQHLMKNGKNETFHERIFIQFW